MPDFRHIYSAQADMYHRLVSREDYQGNLLPAIRQMIRPLTGLNVVECGAGTGRLTMLLAPLVHTITAFDISAHMLQTAHAALQAGHFRNCRLAVADNQRLPIAAKTADLVIAGWSVAHTVGWHPQTWPQEIGRTLAEMRRVLHPGGAIMLIETLGTGNETPHPPARHLARFYRWLESEQGFHAHWLRTDYRFHSVDEAVSLTGFFFGESLAGRIAREQMTIVPECTGIWWRTF